LIEAPSIFNLKLNLPFSPKRKSPARRIVTIKTITLRGVNVLKEPDFNFFNAPLAWRALKHRFLQANQR